MWSTSIVYSQMTVRCRSLPRSLRARWVYADPESLGRASANLLSYAIRFSPANSVLTIISGSVGGWPWIAVADEDQACC
jgi:signal transduction histidine kinase